MSDVVTADNDKEVVQQRGDGEAQEVRAGAEGGRAESPRPPHRPARHGPEPRPQHPGLPRQRQAGGQGGGQGAEREHGADEGEARHQGGHHEPVGPERDGAHTRLQAQLHQVRGCFIFAIHVTMDLFREYLESLPDVVFIQDGIREEDVTKILEEVSDGKYSCEFQVS